jgi:hypothetical protein
VNLSETTHGLKLGGAVGREEDLGHRLEQLNLIGASLSAERDINRLLESILSAAKTIPRADGGTLYRVAEMLAQCLEDGMRTLKQDGMEKCLTGVTHIKEVRAVCIK